MAKKLILAGKGKPHEINEALADMSSSSGYKGSKLRRWSAGSGSTRTDVHRDVEHFNKHSKSKALHKAKGGKESTMWKPKWSKGSKEHHNDLMKHEK